MLFGLFIAAVISIPVAIPALIAAVIIHFVNKNNRGKNNNNYMYANAVPQQNMNLMPDVGFNSDPANMGMIQNGYVMNNAQPVVQPQFAGVPSGDGSLFRSRPEKKKPQREPMSSSTVMLLIGTALVVLSGIAFGAANWLSTSPFGRVCIIGIAAAVSYIISLIFMKAVKLKGTSSAFFMVGSLLIPVALIIASFYDMLGRWLSFDGGGRYLLFAAAFMLTSAGCFAGHRIYKTKHFVYSGLSMASAAFLFIALQTSLIDNAASMSIFASVLIMFQLVITALIYVFRFHEKTDYAEPIKIIGTVTSVFYAAISITYVFATFIEPVFGTFFILGIIIAQLIYYGISKNQKWMLGAQTVLSVILALITVIKVQDIESFNASKSAILFLSLSTAIFFVNRFVPKLRTSFSAAAALTALSLGCVVALDGLYEGYTALIILFSVMTSAIIFAYVFDKRVSVQVAAGIVSPMLPIIIAANIQRMLISESAMESETVRHLVFGTASIIFVAVTALLIALPKFAFNFHAKHPRKTDVILYANMTTVILFLAPFIDGSPLVFIPLAALIAHFITANLMKNNIMAAGSGVISCAYLMEYLKETAGLSDNALLAISFSCFLMLMAVSKIVYGKAVITKKEGRVSFDTALLSGWILIPFMADYGSSSGFFVLLSMAVFTACFVKKNTKDDAASVLLSISAVLTAIALFDRPFLLPYNEMVANKISIAIVTMVGIAFRFIWRKHRTGAYIASNIVFVTAFAALMIDALYFEDPGNTVFVLAVTTAVLIVSFMVKSKTWFSVSSIALVTIILYASKGFLASLSGWVYLFAAGMILIGIAAMNEYYKQKGENVKSRLATVFSDWKW